MIDNKTQMSRSPFQKAETTFTASDAFAIYSPAGSTDHLLISGDINQRSSETGFVIQKFDKKNLQPYFITPQQIFKNTSFRFSISEECPDQSTTKRAYLSYVNDTIEAITKGQFKKVVMSRIKVIKKQIQDDYSFLFQLFEKLKYTYPNAFVFLYHAPGEGCWCGATPEILLESTSESCKTMALAGTQNDKGLSLDQVTWGEKEKYEQGVIEQFVENTLTELNIIFTKVGPSTIKAGEVLHILSTYQTDRTHSPLKLADKLHPGPAICGIPMTSALDWIKNHEDHARDHYCGYIGPWNIEATSALYINLRSMRIYKDHYVLYLGGGITKDSEVESEWQETNLKAQTMMSVINQLEKHVKKP